MSWPMVQVGKYADKVQTWNPAAGAECVFQYVDLSSVDKGRKIIDLDNVAEISSAEAPSRARQLVVTGDVLVATVRPNLNGVAVVPAELNGATASTGYCVLRADEKNLYGRYLFHWVQTGSFVEDMMSKATGANYPAVSDKIIKESNIPLPPLPEQKRIAAILDKADAIRRKRQQAIQLADDFLHAVFLDMFGDPVTNPKGWEEKRIGELVSVKNGFAFKSEYYTERGNLQLLTPGNFYEKGGYRDRGDKQKYYDGPVPPGFLLNGGEILVAMTEQAEGLLGSSFIVPEDGTFLHNQRLGLLDFNSDRLSRDFLCFLFNTDALRRKISESAVGLKVRHTSSSKIEDIVVGIPKYEDQLHFSSVYRKYRATVKNLQRHHKNSIECFFSLSQKAFRGEL